MEIVSALVDVPDMEYFTFTPHELSSKASNRISPTWASRDGYLMPGMWDLIFKIVLFDFSIQRPLGNTQITGCIFALVTVFAQRPDD